MNKMVSTGVIALIVGGVLGYLLHGETPSKKPEVQEQTMFEEKPQKDSNEWKIQNAMSAAPEAIGKNATVVDWPQKPGDPFPELKKGTNDWTCVPDYPGSPGNDPACVDKQGMKWLNAYLTQQNPSLEQAGIGYMLQGASDASNTDPYATKPAEGEDWVTAPAHVMVFPTGRLDTNVYGTDPKSGGSWIMWAGTTYEHLMVLVK